MDGDGIPDRTYPGTHPTKGSDFTRGTSRYCFARYTEEGPAYVHNMQRLLKKFDTARSVVPRPVETKAAQPTRDGVLFYGSTSAAMREALEALAEQGIHMDAIMWLRAFPFHDDVLDFIARHDRIFIVEQNRDAQMKSLVVNECGVDPAKIVSVLHYDGTPITANFIRSAIADRATAANVVPLRKA